MIHRSLRGRIALAAAAATAVVILLGGGLVTALVNITERHSLDRRLAQQTSEVERPLEKAINKGTAVSAIELASRRPDVGTILRVYQNGILAYAVGGVDVSLPTPGRDGYHTVPAGGRSWRMMTKTLHPDTAPSPNTSTAVILETAVPTSATDELVENLRFRAVEVALISAILAGSSGWFLAELALRPLARLRSTAETVSTSRDLSVRVPAAGGPREVHDLAHSLNVMLARLQEAAASTEAALASSRAFAGNAAHEMRTPLTSMQANLDVLQRNPKLPPEQTAEILRSLSQEQSRLVRLLDSLHTLARGDVVGENQTERIDVADLAGIAVESMGRRFPSVSYSYSVPSDEIEVEGWSDGLRLMIENLLINAARHGGSEVRVTVQAGDGTVRMDIDDNGPGIVPEEREAVFERFHRGRQTSVPGSGLGLALVAQQARLHGGNVHVEDSPLGGARFVVTFNAKRGAGR